MVLAAREGMMPGWTWTLAKPIFCFFFSPLLLGYCTYISGTTISLLVSLTLLFSFLEGTIGLINKKIFFWLCEPFGRHVLRWSGSVTNYHCFLLLSQTYVLGNVRSELFLVYGCRLFIFLCCFCFLQQTFILLFILIRRFGI